MSLATIAGLQIRKVRETKHFLNILIYGESGVGKGHPHGTNILTTEGWVKIEDLKINDLAISVTGSPCKVTGIYHRGLLPTFEVIFNDGNSVVVDEEHLWIARTLNHQVRNQPWNVVDTAYIRSTLHRKWRIPIVYPIEYNNNNNKELLIDPYTMGVLLGDGSFVTSCIRLSTDIDTASLVEKLLPTDVMLKPVTENDRSPQWYLTTKRGNPNPLLDAIRFYNLNGLHSYNKFIPIDYLLSSIQDRTSLLQGLMDTDGEMLIRHNTVGTHYSTSSPQLADDVEFLVQSLGGIVRRSIKLEPKYVYKGELKIGRPSYRLNLNLPPDLVPFRSRVGYKPNTKYFPNRVIVDIIPTGDQEVICISVDSPTKTYITEHCIVTHNTSIAGSADAVPEMRRVLLIDVEGGTLSLKTRHPDVDVVRVTNWNEMNNVYNDLDAGNHGYSTIIVDSLTECQKLSMDRIMKKTVEEHEERDAEVPGIREWNINIEQVRKFVRAFRDLPVNTIFTALVKSDKNMKTGAIKRKPSLSGKVADEVAGFLDIVTYLYMKEVDGENKRMLLCGQTEDTVAKDRTDKLPTTIQMPTMTDIWNAVREGRETDAS